MKSFARKIALVAVVATATGVGAEPMQEYLVHYAVYQNNTHNDEPRVLTKKQVAEVAGEVPGQAKNFIGFTDSENTVIQFYVDSPGKIWVEIPSASEKGSYGTHLNLEQYLKLVAELSEPYSRYKKLLNLLFQPW